MNRNRENSSLSPDALRNGDSNAWNEALAISMKVQHKSDLTRNNSLHDKEDVAQETMINILMQLRNNEEFVPDPRIVMHITRQRAIDLFKRERRQKHAPMNQEQKERFFNSIPSGHISPADQVATQDEAAKVLAKLSRDQQDAAVTVLGQGVTEREYAAARGIPLGTVKGRLRLVREKAAAMRLQE